MADLKALTETLAKIGDTQQKIAENNRAAYDELMSRVETIEAKGGAPGPTGMTRQQSEHAKAFSAWLRSPRSSNLQSALEEQQAKAFNATSDSTGGYAVPEELNSQIMLRLRDLSPMRQVASVVSVSSSNYKEVVDIFGTSSGWAGEGDTRSETNTPTLAEIAPTFGTVYSYPKATEEAIADSQFNVESWLISRVSEEIAIAEGQAFIDGNGTKKPTGLFNTSPVSTDDSASPARAFGTLKYIPTGVAGGFGELSTGSPSHHPADILLETVYDLRAGYRQNAVWMMNSATAGVIRRFKNANGDYLWGDSVQRGQPPMLAGYPVIINEAMPDISANEHPVLFGDFQRGYVIADSFATRITVDANITAPGFTKWYVRRRVGGAVRDDHALRAIKVAAS